MDKLFGIPLDTLLVVLVVAFFVVAGTIGALVIRNRVFFKMGVRNIPRRWGRTALIVVGLMLGTAIISAALSTGDTMSHSVRSLVVGAFGHIDEMISVEGASTGDEFFGDTTTSHTYFDEALFDQVRRSFDESLPVDGIAPVIIEDVAVQDTTSQQNEPRVTVFAIDPAYTDGFGDIRQVGGGVVSLNDLAPGEVYLNEKAGEELRASAGDELLVFAADRISNARVKAIVDYDGTGTDGSALILPLAVVQTMLNREGEIRHILVSNDGGSKYTDEVIDAIEPTLGPLGLEIEPVKRDAEELADEVGSAFTSIFAIFGSFSIIAGIMLIFLIFVMLAAERKSEMGIARAVGTQRRNLVEMFLFEGAAYDLAAATIGAGLGLAISVGMVLLMSNAFATFGFDIVFDFRAGSLIIGFTMGLLLTFVIVTVSAWRISVLNIVSAIRNLPEPKKKSRGRTFLWIIGFLIGVLMIFSGWSETQLTPFMLGVSLVIITLIPVLSRLGVGVRLTYTLPAAVLLVWWMLPFSTFDPIFPEFASDISIFIVSGVMVVSGATWIVMYNSDLFVRGMMLIFGRFDAIAPGLKTAVSYALTNRFRTGMTLAMFTLVVFTLVVMATLTQSFNDAFDDLEAYGGGFDVRATTLGVSPVADMSAAVTESPNLSREDFRLISNQTVFSAEARQVGVEGTPLFESYLMRGVDDVFLTNTTYQFAIRADGYETDAEVWQAMRDTPGLAVVDPFVVPRLGQMGAQLGVPEFQLEGFYLEDDSFAPVEVEMRDLQSGGSRTVTVIGVFKETIPQFMYGLATSQATIEKSFPQRAAPNIHLYATRAGTDARVVSAALESNFLANGMEAEALQDNLNDELALSNTFNYIIQGFMGLGLIVGVAALGVISARSVVERRQEIGVMRAIGFQARLVQFSFLTESTLVAVLGIVVGLALGLGIAYNVVVDAGQSSSWDNLRFSVPWINLLIIFAVTYAAALLMTLIPAQRASRVYPATALRYE